MASLFGFGRRRDDSNSDLPVHRHEEEAEEEDEPSEAPTPADEDSAATPPLSPHGSPPTHPTFTPSPMISMRDDTHVSPQLSETSEKTEVENLAIPDIHIFNPAAADTSVQQQEDYGDSYEEEHLFTDINAIENDHAATETFLNKEDDAINIQLSATESYGTAEDQPRQQESYDYDASFYEDNNPQQKYAMDTAATKTHYMEGDEPSPVASQEEVEYSYQLERGEDEGQGEQHDGTYVVTDRRQSSPPVRDTVDDYNGRDKRQTTDPIVHYSSVGLPRTPYRTPSRSSSLTFSALRNSRFRTPNNKDSDRDEALSTINTNETEEKKPPKSPLDEILTPQFKEIHSKTIRRRQTRQKNMQDLERRLAAITSGLANITMDREAQMSHFLRDHICTPMEQASERIATERDFGTSPHYKSSRHWMTLTGRLSRVEKDMMHYVHADVQLLMREKLDQPHNELMQDVLPAFRIETRKSEKREGAILRHFEGVAGTARRRYHEERAARYAAFEVLKQQLLEEAKTESDPARIELAINKVKALRAKLEQERVERRMRDEHLKTAIEQETISMKRAILESSGGDDFFAEHHDSVRRAIAYH